MFNLCDIAPTVARPHQPLAKEEELQGGAAAAKESSASVPAVPSPEANGAAAMSSAAPVTVKLEGGVDNGPSASFGLLLPPPADANGVHPVGPEEGAPRSPPPQDANEPGVSSGQAPGSSVSAAAAVAATVMTMGGGHPNGPGVGSTQLAPQPAQVTTRSC